MKNKSIIFITMITFILAITTTAYADVASPVSQINGMKLFWIVAIIAAVCIFAFVILRKTKNQK